MNRMHGVLVDFPLKIHMAIRSAAVSIPRFPSPRARETSQVIRRPNELPNRGQALTAGLDSYIFCTPFPRFDSSLVTQLLTSPTHT